MFRLVASSIAHGVKSAAIKKNIVPVFTVAVRNKTSHEKVLACIAKNEHFYEEDEYNEEYEKKWIEYFDREDIDPWELRRGMQELHDHDNIPEPTIIISALKACRRLNDYAMAIRYLESVKFKCGPYVKKIYPWLIQEITPTLEELGIETPEQMGYDKPELYCEDVNNL